MNKKILITGGGGMLASQIESFYRKKGVNILAPTHFELDILDELEVRQAINSFKPDYVFHTAALHTNDCEDSPELAFKLNREASKNLAIICSENDATLIYISSCGYFGDEIKYYSEKDKVVLKTVYAQSKHQGETLAIKENRKTFAIRPGWLFGGSITHKKNFVYQRYKEVKSALVVKSAKDKYGCPTYTGDLVEKMDEIIKTDSFGVYHLTNSGGCNRVDYIRKIIESCKLSTKVEPVDSSHFPRKANVPYCELLDNAHLKQLGIKSLPTWEDAVERYTKLMLKQT